ncbi:MAG: glycosyltransferase family 2 protein [Verrucomicrobiota bacterium]
MTDRRNPSLISSTASSEVRCCVIIPSYNSGGALEKTLLSLLDLKVPIWVVIDGSNDGSDLFLQSTQSPFLTTIHRPQNGGKGAAVLEGLQSALQSGFTHALIMDADGQHPTDAVQEFFNLSSLHPTSLILGKPIFGKEAPWVRRMGHSIANFWVHLETGGKKIDDSLFGFRIYPIQDSCLVLKSIAHGKGYDFETQLAVRLIWRGYGSLNVPVPVRYFKSEEGGISHFRYFKDNLLLIGCHISLLWEKYF